MAETGDRLQDHPNHHPGATVLSVLTLLTAGLARVDNAYTSNGRRCHEEEWLDRAMLLSGSGIADAARHGDAAVWCVNMGWHGLAQLTSIVAWLAPVAGKTRRGLLRARIGWHQLCRGSRNCPSAMHWLQAARGGRRLLGGAIGLAAKTPHANIPRKPARGSLVAVDVTSSGSPGSGSAQGLCRDWPAAVRFTSQKDFLASEKAEPQQF